MSADHIRDHWERQGQEFGADSRASWGDNWMIELEIETIGAHIASGDHVLDVGCANGYAAFRQLASRGAASIVGVDYADSMLEHARRVKAQRGLGPEIAFERGDVRRLRFAPETFDVVYTTRVLINLPTWEEQRLAIAECLRVTRKGGTLVLSEGFWEPLALLNAMRLLVALPALVEHDFNRYLKKSRLEEYLRSIGADFRFDDFSSVYYLGSRFLRELVTDPAAYAGYSNPVNELFFEIERKYSGGGFGVQQAVVIRK